MYKYICLAVICFALVISVSASAETKPTCFDECISKYASEYSDCKDVPECQRFVASKTKACIKTCESER